MRNAKTVLLMLLAVVALAGLGACGGSSGPQEHTFAIQVKDGQPVGGESTFQVKQGDTVTLNISSDAAGEVHVHGYDLEKELTPGGTVALSFAAEATGRFHIEIEETKVELGVLAVQPR